MEDKRILRKDYDVKGLVEEFAKHHDECEKRAKELANSEYPPPAVPFPDFSVAGALSCICKEIVDIRNFLESGGVSEDNPAA